MRLTFEQANARRNPPRHKLIQIDSNNKSNKNMKRERERERERERT